MTARLLVLCIAGALLSASAPAQVPRIISYQGVLTGSGGLPPGNGPYDITFRLYADSAGGSALWTESHTGVQVSGGAFHTLLGSVSALDTIDFARQLYLGVTVGSDSEFTPRSALTSAPASLAPWGARDTNLSYVGGNVGIGTKSPVHRLHVSGKTRLDGDLYRGNGLMMHMRGPNCLYLGYNAGELASGDGFGNNTGVGLYALRNLQFAGSANTAVGSLSMQNTTSGQFNAGTGYATLISNTSGSNNTAVGAQALFYNTVGLANTAAGGDAMQNNVSGSYNTAAGRYALYLNTTGSSNTAIGYSALSSNGGTGANTAVGFKALESTTASEYNTAVGSGAGDSYDNGYNNVFVGANTDVSAAGLYNVIAIGQGTVVAASSTARFGNPATGSYGGWAGWSNVSDGRFKKNVRENVPGLAFIARLRPVTYNFDATGMDAYLHRGDPAASGPAADNATPADRSEAGDVPAAVRTGSDATIGVRFAGAAAEIHRMALTEKERIVYTGFVAQEVEEAARGLGFEFSAVDAPKDGTGYYSLRYAEFVVPLVKAVQEQQAMIEELRREIERLRSPVSREE